MKKQKSLSKWTVKEFKKLPSRKWEQDIGEFDSLVILPTKQNHDSGYACMDFIAVKNDIPLCRLSGCSDVIHIDGIGGFGFDWLNKRGGVPNTIAPIGWSIDCLKKSRLLRIFTGRGKLIAGPALSSFELYSLREIKN